MNTPNPGAVPTSSSATTTVAASSSVPPFDTSSQLLTRSSTSTPPAKPSMLIAWLKPSVTVNATSSYVALTSVSSAGGALAKGKRAVRDEPSYPVLDAGIFEG